MKLYLVIIETYWGSYGTSPAIFAITTSRQRAEEIVESIENDPLTFAKKKLHLDEDERSWFIQSVNEGELRRDGVIIEVTEENINTLMSSPIYIGGYIE